MKLCSLHIENFGKLSNYDHVFTDGLNVIKHENSWGKTTLATFLKAMFYGMEKKGNLKAYCAERSKYMPWQGGVYGGSVIFEVNGKTYRVLRTFAPTPEGDRFELIDLETNKPSKDYSSNLGEEIFKVGRETFALSTFFPQGELEGKINDEIRSYLTGINDISGDVDMQSKAIKKLKGLEREYKITCPKTYDLISLEDAISDNKAQLKTLEEQREEIKSDVAKLQEKVDNFKFPNEYETEKPGKIGSLISNLEQEKNEIDAKVSKAIKRAKARRLLPIVGIALSAALMIVGILIAAFAVSLVAGIVVAVAAAIAAGVGIGILLRAKHKLGAVLVPLKNRLKQIEQKKIELQQKYQQLAAQTESLLEEAKVKKDLQVELAVDNTKLEHIEKDVVRLLEKLDDQETTLASLKTQKEELEEKQKITACVIECLIQGQENISKRYVQPMQQQFNAIISRLSGDKHIVLDSDLNVNLDTQSGLKEKEFLSTGNQDMVEICKRFALIKSIFKHQTPFIILDDPFVNLDEKALDGMLKVVKDFSNEMQIIYLVCHSSRIGE